MKQMPVLDRMEPAVRLRPHGVRLTLTLSGVVTTLFLLPSFFQRLFIGGEELASYSEYPGITLVAVGYLCHLLIVGQYLLVRSPRATTRFILERFVPLAIASVFHVGLLALSTDVGATMGILSVMRQMLWILACLVMVRFTDSELLLTRVIQLTHLSFAVIVITYVSYLVTDVPAQMILRGGVPRAQGFFTEPSAVGCLLAGYAALAVCERRPRRLLYAIGIAVLVNSVISFAGIAIGVASALIRTRIRTQRRRRMGIVALLLMMPAALVVIPPFSRPISESATDVMSYVETTPWADSPIYVNFGKRVLDAAGSLEAGIETVKTGDNNVEGGLFRFVSVVLLFQDMAKSWRLFVGYGLGAHAQLREAVDQSLLDFGLLAFAVSSFGLIAGMGLFGWLVWMVSCTDRRLAVYAAPFLAVISFNPAGGMHMYSIALLAAFLLSRIKRPRGIEPARLG